MRGLVWFIAALVLMVLVPECADAQRGGSETAAILGGLAAMMVRTGGYLLVAIFAMVGTMRMFGAPAETAGTTLALSLGAVIALTAGVPSVLSDTMRQGMLRHAELLCPAGSASPSPAPSGGLSFGAVVAREAITEPPDPRPLEVTVTSALHEIHFVFEEPGITVPDVHRWTARRLSDGATISFEGRALSPGLAHSWGDNRPIALISLHDDTAWAFTQSMAVRLSFRDREARAVETPGDISGLRGGYSAGQLTPERVIALEGGRLAFITDAGPIILSEDGMERFATTPRELFHPSFDDVIVQTADFVCFSTNQGNPVVPRLYSFVLRRGPDPALSDWERFRAATGATGAPALGVLGLIVLATAGAVAILTYRRRPQDEVPILLSLGAVLCVSLLLYILKTG